MGNHHHCSMISPIGEVGVFGRLRVIEKIGPPPRAKRGPYDVYHNAMRVLCLCACGRTRECYLRDFRLGRVMRCCRNCVRDQIILWPHRRHQRLIRYAVHVKKRDRRPHHEFVTEGPPFWDPVNKRGYFIADREEREKALAMRKRFYSIYEPSPLVN